MTKIEANGVSLRPARALLHPAWWLALAVMGLNDHVAKGHPLLAGEVTGKLSDITGLFLAPVVLATVCRMRTRRQVLLAHVLIGLWFAAMNLLPPFAQAWAALTALGPFAPWRPVVDAADLLTLPMLWVGWRVLLPAMLAAPMQQASVRLRWQNAWQAVALTCAAPLLLANTPEPERPWQPGAFQMAGVTLAVGNGTSAPLLLRIRALRKEVQVDCAAIQATPAAFLSRRLFAPAQAWMVPNGSVIDFVPAEEKTRDCPAFLIDGPSVPLQLAFWRQSDYLPTGVGSLLDDDRTRVLVIAPGTGTGSVLAWQPHAALGPPPPALDPAPDASCPFPDAESGLAWSAPVPLGADITLVAMQASPDDCIALDLLQNDAGAKWYLCVPYASFPFEPGERLTVTKAEKDYAFGALDGVRIDSGPDGAKAVTLGRGTSVPYFGKGTVISLASKGCAGKFDACGGMALRLDLHLADIAGQESQTLQVGQAAVVGKGKLLHLMRALRRITVDGGCKDDQQNTDGSGAAKLGPMVESVLVEEP